MKEKNRNLKIDMLIFSMFLIPIATIVLNSPITIGDEIWNFQNSMKMSRGLEIYKDCNVIVTPIFFYIGKMFLQLLGENLLSFRIYNILIFNLFIFSLYKLFNLLKIDKLKSFVYACIVFFIIMPYINIGANYNILAIFIYIVGMMIYISKKDSRYFEVLLGIFIYLVLFTKQNIGVFFVFSTIIACFLNYKSKAILKLFKVGVISLSVCALTVLVMYLKGILPGFINYTILGMSSFTGSNFIIDKRVLLVLSMQIIIILLSYIIRYIYIGKKDKSYTDINDIVIFSIFLNLSIFPIVNLYHTTFAMILNIVLIIYVLNKILESDIKKISVNTLKMITIISYIFINIYGIMCGIRFIQNVEIIDKENTYFYSNMSRELYNDMNEVVSYIKARNYEGIDVVILSQNAALYMIPLNQSHGELDLAFRGNLGYNGEEGLRVKLDNMVGTEILLSADAHWQEVEEVRLHIIRNFQKIGNIGQYYILKK